jgi:hypothetical protein
MMTALTDSNEQQVAQASFIVIGGDVFLCFYDGEHSDTACIRTSIEA